MIIILWKKRILVLILINIFIWAHKWWGNWLWARNEFTNRLTIILYSTRNGRRARIVCLSLLTLVIMGNYPQVGEVNMKLYFWQLPVPSFNNPRHCNSRRAPSYSDMPSSFSITFKRGHRQCPWNRPYHSLSKLLEVRTSVLHKQKKQKTKKSTLRRVNQFTTRALR